MLNLDNKMVVYLVKNEVNGMYYVGKTERKLKYRWSEHLSCSDKYSFYLHNAIKKYHKENFSIEVLGKAKTLEELKSLERLWIIALGSYIPSVGYNLTYGGDGVALTPESRLKISIKNTGHVSIQRGKTYEEFYGKERATEIKQKISLIGKNIVKTDEWNKKNSIAHLGVPKNFSEQAKANIRASNYRRRGVSTGPKSLEHKEKLSKSKKGKCSEKLLEHLKLLNKANIGKKQKPRSQQAILNITAAQQLRRIKERAAHA